MPSVEERLAVLEGRVQEQATFMTDLRGTGADVRREISDLRQEAICAKRRVGASASCAER